MSVTRPKDAQHPNLRLDIRHCRSNCTYVLDSEKPAAFLTLNSIMRVLIDSLLF